MGCAISKFHTRIVDLSKRANACGNTVAISAHNLHTYLSPDNPNPKCIFIFGGAGSNKGQFIWEVLEQSSENFIDNDNNAAALLLLGEPDYLSVKFSYYYIDVEKLIVENLEKRIKKLSINMQTPEGLYVNNYLQADNMSNHMGVDSPDIFIHRSPKRRKSSQNDELRTQLLLYANIITNSWVLSLIKKEIEDNNFGPYERIFIINLIPNRVSLFKNCLFLKQTPSFASFNFNYIAINLIKHASKRKDLEIKLDEQLDEINNNFINYFRVINKLIDIRVENFNINIYFKLSTSKNAIRIASKDELISFIYMPKRDQLELDIFEFKFDDYAEVFKVCKKASSLLFVINREVELDDNIVLRLDEKKVDLEHVRKFIQLYRLVRYALSFS